MSRVRNITFTLPLFYRGAGLEVRATTTQRHDGKPWWPSKGSEGGVTVEVHEGRPPRIVYFALFNNDHEIIGGQVEVSNGQVRRGDRRLFPVIGDRSLFDINIVPGFSHKEAS